MEKTVLIVEDERLLARTLSTALSEAGYGARVAHTPEQAEEAWGSGVEFDLVIMDNRLPRRTGLDLLRLARERGRESRIILMTAFDSREVKEEAQRLQVDRYVRKPFDLDGILNTVRELIGAPGVLLRESGGTGETKQGGG